jgi:hypothetical protein
MSSSVHYSNELLLTIPDLLCWNCERPVQNGHVHKCGVLKCHRKACDDAYNGDNDDKHPGTNCKAAKNGWISINNIAYMKNALDNLLVGCRHEGCLEKYKYMDKYKHYENCKYKTKTCAFCLVVGKCAVIDTHINDINLCVGNDILPNWCKHPQFKSYLEQHKIITTDNNNNNSNSNKRIYSSDDEDSNAINPKKTKINHKNSDNSNNPNNTDTLMIDVIISDKDETISMITEWFEKNQHIIGDKIKMVTVIYEIILKYEIGLSGGYMKDYIDNHQDKYSIDKTGDYIIRNK